MVNVQVVDTGNMVLPAICAGCGAGKSSPRDYFVDTGINFDWWGAVYFCDECVKDVVKVCRTAVPLQQLIDTEMEVLMLKKALEEASRVLKVLEELGINANGLIRLGEVNGRVDANSDDGSHRDESVSKRAEHDIDATQPTLDFAIPTIQLT